MTLNLDNHCLASLGMQHAEMVIIQACTAVKTQGSSANSTSYYAAV